ncbi:hypothetical protein MXB_3263 [Myxobolus squamalis]|nr:hypothetical protein MXB_3263 [Myxobolus squamalis]
MITFFQKTRKPKKNQDLPIKEKTTSESIENDSVTKLTTSGTSTIPKKTDKVSCDTSPINEENIKEIEVTPYKTATIDSMPSIKIPDPHPSVDETLVGCKTVRPFETKLEREVTQTVTILHEEKIEEKAPLDNNISDETAEPLTTSSDKTSLASAEVITETKREESSDDEPDVADTAKPEESDIKSDEPPSEVKEEETLAPKIISESTEDD